MSRVTNPYFAGPPATQPETFFGREDVLRFVDDTLTSPMHNAIVLYGQRRIGKTSILHQIARRRSQDYQAVFFDLQSSVDRPVEELLFSLAREIADQLNIMAPNRADFKVDSEFFRTVFLPYIYEQLGEKRLLLLLDEFDALSLETSTPAELDALDALPFVQALNRIIQSDDRQVVFLFVVGRRLKDLTANQLQIFRGALDRQITLLKQESCVQLITRPAQDVLTYGDGAVERIWSLTSGHPYFAQLICHKIFNEIRHQNVWIVTESHVDAVIEDVIGASQTALRWFWNEVPPVERFILHTIGRLTTASDGVSLDQLLAERDAQRIQVPDLELRAIPDRLVDRQVLMRDEKGHYHFAVEVVRRWIVQTHSSEEVKSELTRVAVDESAKDFFRAGRAAYLSDDTDFAINSFGRALGINPDYVEARLWLARTRLKADDLLAAIDEFTYVERYGGKEATDARVGLADARAEYGRQLETEAKIEAAKQEYARALKLAEQHPLANTRLSEIYRREADGLLEAEGISKAQPLYELAIKHKTEQELEHKINTRLAEYSQAQEEAKNWQAAEQARQLAIQFSQTEDDHEALLRVQLEWGRWHLDQQEFDEAATLYRRLLDEPRGDSPREMIETDLLRYSQQAEEKTDWARAEATLGILAGLFRDDTEAQGRLAENLCRQGEFYLGQGKLAKSKAAYQRALTISIGSEAVDTLVREGFQAYYRTHRAENTVTGWTSIVEAMQVQVALLGSDDVQAYERLLSAREALGEVLYKEGSIAEAHQVYLQAWDDVTHWLQLTDGSDEIFRHRAVLGLQLGVVELDRGAFREATETLQQALADTQADPKMVNEIKKTFFDYRYRQEEMLRWGQAENAMNALHNLFPDDEEVSFALAETRVAQTEWHLQRAIPDLEAARRFAQAAREIDLPFVRRDLIATRIKDSFIAFCEAQESSSAPKWPQAEYAMNSLVSFFPGDAELNRQLGELRIVQGDWYLDLAQKEETLIQIRNNLLRGADAYKRALEELPHDEELIDHIKTSFRNYREQQRSTWSQAGPAIETLAEALPDDEEIQQWLVETEEKKPSIWARPMWHWGVTAAVIIVLAVAVWSLIPYISNTPGPTQPPTSTQVSVKPTETNTPTPDIPDTPPAGAAQAQDKPTDTATPLPSPTEEPVAPEPATEEPSPGPTPSGTPTPTDTSIPTPYPAPQLLRPSDGFEHAGASPLPQLAWQPVGNLGDDEYYQVRYGSVQSQQIYTHILTGTTWELPVETFHQLDFLRVVSSEQTIDWQVQVVREEDGQFVELSTRATRTFSWHQESLPLGEALDVTINPNNHREMLAVLRDQGIYRTINGGISWTETLPEEISKLYMSPAQPAVVYAGGIGHIWQSQDGGENWEGPLFIKTDGQRLNARVNDILTHPQSIDVVFVATDRGILRSDDGGYHWEALGQDADLDKQFHDILLTNLPRNRLYAVGEDDQVYWRGVDDISGLWQKEVCHACDPPILALTIDTDNDRMLAAGDNGTLAVSTDWGENWEALPGVTPSTLRRLMASVVVIDPTDPQIIYVGTGTSRNSTEGEGLYCSDDGGVTWTQLLSSWAYIENIIFDPEDTQKIYISGTNGVYYSPDGGNIWIKL